MLYVVVVMHLLIRTNVRILRLVLFRSTLFTLQFHALTSKWKTLVLVK